GGLYSGKADSLSYIMYALLVIGGLNTVVSLFYYIKVLKVMILDKPEGEAAGQAAAPLPVPLGSAIYASSLALVVLAVGIFWGPFAEASDRGAGGFHANLKKSTKLSTAEFQKKMERQ